MFVVALCHVIVGGVPFTGVPCQLNVNPTEVFDQLFMLRRKVAVKPAGIKPAWFNGGVEPPPVFRCWLSTPPTVSVPMDVPIPVLSM